VRAPVGLKDGFAWSTGHPNRLAHRAVFGEVGHPELGPVPWHAGVVPARPGQLSTIGADPGERAEVASREDHPWRRRAVGWECDQLVGDLAALVRLAHADDQPLVGGEARVGIAKPRARRWLRSDWNGRFSRAAPVDPLIVEVREEDGLALHEIR